MWKIFHLFGECQWISKKTALTLIHTAMGIYCPHKLKYEMFKKVWNKKLLKTIPIPGKMSQDFVCWSIFNLKVSFLSIILVKSLRNQEMWASGSPQDRKWLYKQPVMLSVGPRAVGFPNPTLKIILGKVLFKCFKMSYLILKLQNEQCWRKKN